VLVIDAANVVGSRPTGWWRDRAGAARGFVDRVVATVAGGSLVAPVTVVVEGAARGGVPAGPAGPGVDVVHAPGSGDDAIVAVATAAGGAAGTGPVRVVTADRGLRARLTLVAVEVVGPSWLWDRLDAADSPAT